MADRPTTVGIDDGKDPLDVGTLPTGETYRVSGESVGHAILVERLRARQRSLRQDRPHRRAPSPSSPAP